MSPFKSVLAVGLSGLVLSIGISAQAQQATSRLAKYSKVDRTVRLAEVGGNLSGVTYNYDTDTYFMVQNNTGKIFEYDKEFKHLRTIVMTNLKDDDQEGIVYLGNEEFAVSSETNIVLIFKIAAGQTVVDGNTARTDVQQLSLPAPRKDNKGLEGVCFTKRGGAGAGMFYAVQEHKPKRIFRFERPLDKADKASQKMSVSEPFDAERILKHRMSDLSDCVFDDVTNHLVLLSHESSALMELDVNGKVVNTLPIPKVADQYEGVTIGAEGELILVSEPNILVIMK